MRKFLTFVAALFITGSLLAGGLVTNTNGSAMYTRLLNRNASTDIDAVYFNPAGLTKLGDGFYVSVNNQTITQKQTITNNYNYLSGTKPKEYIGDVKAPIYPSVYVAYKKGKFAFSGGFNVIGGGGGATFNTGLPVFEMPISDLVPGLTNQLTPLDQAFEAATGNDPGFSNITGYNADLYFEGTSAYFGYQANVSYEINDMISVAVGGRYVSAKNTYEGYITGATITAMPNAVPGGLTPPYVGAPGDYLRDIALTPYGAASAGLLNATAAQLDAMTEVEADVVEQGSGFTPIVSVNISPSDMFNIALRYEFKTNLDLETTVYDGKDAGGMFVDGATKVADMPAMMSAGVGVHPTKKLFLAAGMGYYFDKNNDYDGSDDIEVEMIDKNFFEYSFGVEYALSDMFRISAGYSGSQTGVNEDYQSDLRYSLNTTTFAGGFGITINPMIDINIGGMYTMYQDGGKTITPDLPVPPINETYDTSTWVIGFGVDFHF